MSPAVSRPVEPSGDLVSRLYQESGAARWSIDTNRFRAVLEASVVHAFGARDVSSADVERYLSSLHLTDLALATGCAAGCEPAWEQFMQQQRPALYRAADAIDPSGGLRDLADAIYADLFGLKERDGERQSLFRYFHGRSSLSTWLRAVLAQRHIDRLRAGRRLEPLADDDSDASAAVAAAHVARDEDDPERPRFLSAMRRALGAAIDALEPRDRLRLKCYYAQDMTLAAIGRMLKEHEATASRHLTRTRKEIRGFVEAHLRREDGFDDRALADCFRSVAGDAGPLDLSEILGDSEELPPRRKKPALDRSR